MTDYKHSKRLAICIGINSYSNLGSLSCSVNDAEAVAKILQNPNLGNFDSVNTVIDDINGDVTYERLRDELDDFFKKHGNFTPDTILVLFFAGHASLDDNNNLVLLTSNSEVRADKTIKHTTGYSFTNFESYLAKCEAREVIILLDACYSGGSIKLGERVSYRDGYNIHILAAAQSKQEALASERFENHGAFTYCLLEAFNTLQGKDDGWITIFQLQEFVISRLLELRYKRQEIQFLNRGSSNPKIVKESVIKAADELNEAQLEALDFLGDKTKKISIRPSVQISLVEREIPVNLIKLPPINSILTYNEDSYYIAFLLESNQIIIYNSLTNNIDGRIECKTFPSVGVIKPTSSIIALLNADDQVEFWNWKKNEKVELTHLNVAKGICFSPDGNFFLACGGAPEGTIRTWKPQDLTKPLDTVYYTSTITMFSANLYFIIGVSKENPNILLSWQILRKNPYFSYINNGNIKKIFFLEQNFFVTLDANNEIKIWKINVSQPYFSLPKFFIEISDITYKKKGNLLVILLEDSSIVLCDIKNNTFYVNSSFNLLLKQSISPYKDQSFLVLTDAGKVKILQNKSNFLL